MLGDALWIVAPIAICVGSLWLASRIEPHWSAKDGRRFLTTAQVVDRHGLTTERRREVRVNVATDGTLVVSRRGLFQRDRHQTFVLDGRSPDPPRGKQIYVLSSVPPDAGGNRLLLRLPAKSACVSVLDELLDGSR